MAFVRPKYICGICEHVWRRRKSTPPKSCPRCGSENISVYVRVKNDQPVPQISPISKPLKPAISESPNPEIQIHPTPEIEPVDNEIAEAQKLEQRARIMKATRLAQEGVDREEEAARKHDQKEKLSIRERTAAAERDELLNEKMKIENERLRNSPIVAPMNNNNNGDNGHNRHEDRIYDELKENRKMLHDSMQGQIDNLSDRAVADSGAAVMKGGMDILAEGQRSHNKTKEVVVEKGLTMLAKKMGGKDEIVSREDLIEDPPPRSAAPPPDTRGTPPARRRPPPQRREDDLPPPNDDYIDLQED